MSGPGREPYEQRLRKCDWRYVILGKPDRDAVADAIAEARRHDCAMFTRPEFAPTSPHLQADDDGTAYCRMCEALARLDAL